jgi:hypothetical protein
MHAVLHFKIHYFFPLGTIVLLAQEHILDEKGMDIIALEFTH